MGYRPYRLDMWRELCDIHVLRCRIDEQRQHYGEHASFPQHTLYIEASSMSLHELT